MKGYNIEVVKEDEYKTWQTIPTIGTIGTIGNVGTIQTPTVKESQRSQRSQRRPLGYFRYIPNFSSQGSQMRYKVRPGSKWGNWEQKEHKRLALSSYHTFGWKSFAKL